MHAPADRADVNVRASRYWILRSVATCSHCAAPTPVLALAVPAGHLALELDDGAQDEQSAVDVWRIAVEPALLFHIDHLSPGVAARLRQTGRALRWSADRSWRNHCERCGATLDDDDLFCEPGGAFLPDGALSASLIQRIAVDEPIEATAAGQASPPPFFDAAR